MKIVLIIEHDIAELESLMDICRLGSEKLTIISAQNENCAHTTLSNKRIDLIICSTHFPDSNNCQVLARIAKKFPYIPLIAIAPDRTVSSPEVLKLGASAFLNKPLNSKKLLNQVNGLSELSSTGLVRDIPIHSFLQMLENEEKTCTLQVFSNNNTGFIYINDGTLVDAETALLDSEDAIYEIISWDNTIVEIKYFNGHREKQITKPLISLIMEGFRLKDEKEEKKKQEQTIVKPKHNLKQVSTAGQKLALDIGLQLKMEFDSVESSLDSTLIGMIPENCIITSTPSHFIITRSEAVIGSIALIKFIYIGKLCLFRSRLIKSIISPHHMLFFEYPTIIHYHEMRKAKRAAIYVPCTLELPDGKRYFGAFTDLSSLGGLCLIKTKGNTKLPEVSINQNVELKCILPGLSDDQSIAGISRNIKSNSQQISIGIEFLSLHSYLKEIISQYLYSINKSEVSVQLDEF